jgi:hypothetical protein
VGVPHVPVVPAGHPGRTANLWFSVTVPSFGSTNHGGCQLRALGR